MVESPKKSLKRNLFFKYIDKVTFSQAIELANINSSINRMKAYLKFKIYNLKKQIYREELKMEQNQRKLGIVLSCRR